MFDTTFIVYRLPDNNTILFLNDHSTNFILVGVGWLILNNVNGLAPR